MPKTYSESERSYIKKRLIKEATLCLERFGMRKTTVDELVKRTKIPKGTFYLFYESKELLFFDVFCIFHDELHQKLLKEIAAIKDDITPDKLTALILGLYKFVDRSFLLNFMTNGEMEFLIQRLPSEIVEAHAEKDDFSMEVLVSLVPGMKAGNIKAFSAALRGIFLTMLHKHEIGEDIFDDALKLMIHGIVLQMFEEESV
ncbi:MAG: TetR family transcriptional regulator [Oscillospiraceae bacterium]|jgi:AcrR family transcriptional regulator|nr:TetR family transcriptional regulator [Oscillospiraceae bacterium]